MTVVQQIQQTLPATVLVVDDEVAIVKVLRDFLEAEGFAVLMARDGEAALALLAREPADCLLLDIMMPGADGFDVCREIRATTERADPVPHHGRVRPAGSAAGLAATDPAAGRDSGHRPARDRAQAGALEQYGMAGGDLPCRPRRALDKEVAEVRSAFEVVRDGLNESIEQQAALEEERRLFIGAIAHDLRTPLFTLRAYLRGLQKGLAATPEKVREYVDECATKADAMERLIADLFAFTRLEYLEQEPERAPLELGTLLRQTVEGARPLAAANGAVFTATLPASHQAMAPAGPPEHEQPAAATGRHAYGSPVAAAD